jgi:hypothetical protein
MTGGNCHPEGQAAQGEGAPALTPIKMNVLKWTIIKTGAQVLGQPRRQHVKAGAGQTLIRQTFEGAA